MDNSPETPQPASAFPGSILTERILKREILQIDRKRLVFTLKENHNGKYLRISEESGGHRNTIIIPANGIETLQRALGTFLG
jgi:hypothetical protein